MGPKRATHRHKSSGPTSAISDYTLGSQAQQTRSGYVCTILLTHPKPSSWSYQRVPPHRLPSTSVPLTSHLCHVLLPFCSVLLISSPQQTLHYCLSPSSPQVCHPFPTRPQSCCPSASGRRVVPRLCRPQSSPQATFTPLSPLIAVGTPRAGGTHKYRGLVRESSSR